MAFIGKKDTYTHSDVELVQQYRDSGNTVLLGNLYQRYMDLVYGVCLKYLKDPDTAKDAVMNIFEELVEKLRKHEVENFKSWLHTLSRNHCLMQLRKQKGKTTVEISEQFMQTGEMLHLNGAMQKEEQLKRLEHCIEQLSSEQQTCVKLFYLDGKCYKDITAQTGIEWNKVRSYIQNGRRNLKLCMETGISSP